MSPARAGASPAFETAQAALFDAIGVQCESWFLALDRPAVRTQVFQTGDPDSDGRPLLFLHGTAAFGAFLAPLMRELLDYRIIGFDRPGHGLSGPYTYRPATVRQTTVDTVGSVIDALDLDTVDLVGHSMGGFAGIEFARTHPDRVNSLSLVGSVPMIPGTAPPLPVRLSTMPIIRRVIERLQPAGEAGVLEIAAMFGERESIQEYPELIQAIAAHEADPTSLSAGQSEFRSLMTLRGWRSSVELRATQLMEVPHPTAVVWGTQDPLGTPDEVRRSITSIRHVRFETVDAGHMPFLAHPRRCAELIRDVSA